MSCWGGYHGRHANHSPRRKVDPMRQVLTVMLLLTLPVVIHADEPAPSATIPLQDTPTTMDAALKRLSDRTAKLDARLAEIQAAHEKAASEAEAETIGYLKAIAKDFASQGEIAEATKVWTEVITLDNDNEDAKAYLKAIGRLDVVQKQVAKAKSPLKRGSEQMQRVEFRCTDGRTFKKMPNGTWIDSKFPDNPSLELSRVQWGGHVKEAKGSKYERWILHTHLIGAGEENIQNGTAEFVSFGRWVR